MIDLNTEFGAQVLKRLQDDDILWFTTVSPRGKPSTNPVWFHWDGEAITVYSQPGSQRVRNLEHNPQVVLNLQGVDGLGNNVVIIHGEARLKPGNSEIPAAYWKKYSKFLQNMTEKEMIADYSVEIRVVPTRVHG
jgi:PPOX class probable F420-dependent enzyme